MIQYTKQQLLENLANKDEQERTAWLKKHTDEEIVEIMKTTIEIAEDTPELANDKDFIDTTTNIKIDVGLLENSIIDEQVNDVMNEIEFQANMKESDVEYQQFRTAMQTHILENPNDKETIEMAKQCIEVEKQNSDYYGEDNWKVISHLL